MATTWGLTIDCAHPGALAKFWALALGYAEQAVPIGFDRWEDWLRHHGVPEEEWDDGAYLSDPAGLGPTISFLKVPEGKAGKNRLHIDIKVGGGRQNSWEVRWPRITEAIDLLTVVGATLIRIDHYGGHPDHAVMADPEGNEFCLV